jgi:F-type H+-transporting ATPase subunit delta
MSTAKVSRRYAQALFDLIQEGAPLQAALNEAAAFAGNDDVLAVLESPAYPASVKAGLFDKVVSGKGSDEIKRLVALLAERGKVQLLPEIASLVEELIAAASSEVDAEVSVAVDLDDKLKDALAAALSEASGRKVRMNVNKDESILGGVVVRIGDRKLDYSLKSKLDGLKRSMVG